MEAVIKDVNKEWEMKIFPMEGSVLVASLLLCCGQVVAGGLSTPGQGARALSMASAFTAMADDGSAVFYNPAGISQLDGTSVEGGISKLSPDIRYTTPSGVTEKSTKSAFAPNFFMAHRLGGKLAAGLGIYTPYARDAELSNDLANGFLSQRAKLVRTDLSAVMSYQANNIISIGGGVVVGFSQLDRSIPAGPTLRIKDKMDGVGVGGIVGILWKLNEHLKAGVTYRTKLSVDHDGKRTLVDGGVAISSDARAEVHYPASLGLGMALSPREDLTLALDVDWYGWSAMDRVTVRTDAWPDSTTQLNARNSRDIRVGAEYRLPAGWAVRAGYAYAQRAFPVTNIIPAQPDGNGSEIGLGVGKTTGPWRFDLVYHYAVTREDTVSTNVFGYNGKYNISQHLLGLTVGYRL